MWEFGHWTVVDRVQDCLLHCGRSFGRLGDTLWYTMCKIACYTVVDRSGDLVYDCCRLCGSLVVELL